MRVKNGRCLRRLSLRSLWGQRRRNRIAMAAIALTTLLFTALFTVVLSINASYQTFQFRQLGGYNHGTFKEVKEEQIEKIVAHPLVREGGLRLVVGYASGGVFDKNPSEISYMDENCSRWSYALPEKGHLPSGFEEITMDTRILDLLGVVPEIGAKVKVDFSLYDSRGRSGPIITKTFTLAGWWEYDSLMPVHYLNISKEMAESLEQEGLAAGMSSFRRDLNVFMASSLDIRGQMEKVAGDNGYPWEEGTGEGGIRLGVNWGYTSAQLFETLDPGHFLAIVLFLFLVILTGYLIIYNIFQISVAEDIRYYGLLKTIGVTGRQLRKILRGQALALSAGGIPLGLFLGYGVGALVMPAIVTSTNLSPKALTLSASPLIFVASILFSLGTVLFSCSRPGRQASRVPAVEASRYTQETPIKGARKAAKGAKVYQMAWANLGRGRKKTALVVISLALPVFLFNTLVLFVRGFDMQKYLSSKSCADFIVSSPDYFRVQTGAQEYLSREMIARLQEIEASLSGLGYKHSGNAAAWMDQEDWQVEGERYLGKIRAEQMLAGMEQREGKVESLITIEGLDEALLSKLKVLKGDISPLSSPEGHYLAVAADLDDYGNLISPDFYPAIGEKLVVVYGDRIVYVDSRTGELCEESTPPQYQKMMVEGRREVEYTVCALVEVPFAMSLRYGMLGYEVVMPVEELERDSGKKAMPLFYLLDTEDGEREEEAEKMLSEWSKDPLSPILYESKASLREAFSGFQSMFMLLGGVLLTVTSLVGVLNFLNADMTSILSRRREFALLQAVGMTGRQLKRMLILEGLFYALTSSILALLLSLLFGPLAGRIMEKTFWFFTYRFTILPVFAALPVFTLMGWLIPALVYASQEKESVVERLREL